MFIGSVKTSQAKSNTLRRILQKQCLAEPTCAWQETAHKCTGVLNQTAAMTSLFRRTTFCLAPTGDSLTRKSVFDSLLTGCIPVIFARATMTQYKWYFSSEVEGLFIHFFHSFFKIPSYLQHFLQFSFFLFVYHAGG